MGNRAHLMIYMKKDNYSEEFMDYHNKVNELYKTWNQLLEGERNLIKSDLLKTSRLLGYSRDDSYWYLPSMLNCKINDENYHCNNSFEGEYCDSAKEEKRYVPLEWCLLFSPKDKVKHNTHDYRTTVKKALRRIRKIKGNSHLIEWLNKYPPNAFVALSYSELYLNDNFNDNYIVDTMAKANNRLLFKIGKIVKVIKLSLVLFFGICVKQLFMIVKVIKDY